MKRYLTRLLLIAAILLLVLTGLGITYTQAQPATPDYATMLQRPHVPGRVLVKFAPGSDSPLKHTAGARHLFDDWYSLPVSKGKDMANVMAAFDQSDDVLLVQPDYLLQLDDPAPVLAAPSPQGEDAYPNDPYYYIQWHMPQVQSDAAWEINRGANVIVAVLDSGLSRGSDLQCRTLVSPYDTLSGQTGENAVRDEHGHGTHVSGTIGQCTNNNVGVVGLAPDVKIMPVRVLDATGSGSMSNMGIGLRWAADHGAKVINLSLGMDCNNADYEHCRDGFVDDAISYAVSRDVVIVAASGNDNRSTPHYPANHPDTIAVAAVDYNRNRTWYSNRGAVLNLSAPGGDTARDDNHDGYPDGVLQQTIDSYGEWGYYFMAGTSMATPHVAAAVALLRSYVPQADRLQVQYALEATAMDLGAPGRDDSYGYGLIQVADALHYLKAQLNPPTPTPGPTATPTPTSTATPIPTSTPTPSSTPTPTATPTASPTPDPNFTPTTWMWLPLTWRRQQPSVPTPTPTIDPNKGIYGRITYNNDPISGVTLNLHLLGTYQERIVAFTRTDDQGNYRFTNIPTLPIGATYRVVFGPNLDDNRFVTYWFGPGISSYITGQTRHGGDFDIADVKMIAPQPGVTRTLPVRFSWHKRVFRQDSYKLTIFDPISSDSWITNDLGYTEEFTLYSLAQGMQYGKVYGWYPTIMNGDDSYGLPFHYREITFTAGAAQIPHPSALTPTRRQFFPANTATSPTSDAE